MIIVKYSKTLPKHDWLFRFSARLSERAPLTGAQLDAITDDSTLSYLMRLYPNAPEQAADDHIDSANACE